MGKWKILPAPYQAMPMPHMIVKGVHLGKIESDAPLFTRGHRR